MGETKKQILDAAEGLFASCGIGSVPLRRIIGEANVNAAAIHYHFGSKEELVKAVFLRRFGPLKAMRIELLDRLAEAPGTPRVEDICYAIVAPAFRMGQESGCGPVARCLAGRLMTEPDYMELVFGDLFAEVDRRVDALMKRALPDLPDDVRVWRKFMATGSMVFLLREQELIPKLSAGLCDTGDVEVTIRRLVQFMSAGLRAPVAEVSIEPSLVREPTSV